MRGAFAAGLLLLSCCGGDEPAPELFWIRVTLPATAEPSALRWEPPLTPREDRHASGARDSGPVRGGVRAIGFARSEAPASMRFFAPGACPLDVEPLAAHQIELRPWIRIESEYAQRGFDAPIELRVEPGCAAAVAGRIHWRRLSGPPLSDRVETQRGFVVRGRTATREALLPGPAPWGVVPVSAHARGLTVFEATWRAVGVPEVTIRTQVSAAARSGGLPSVPVGHRVYLGGEGWTVSSRPERARSDIEERGGLASLMLDVGGVWRLEDAFDRELTLRVGRFDETPLDCGRAECHRSAAQGAAPSPMTSALERGLTRSDEQGSCALDCHVVGEAGTPDGGFAHVMREMGREPTDLRGWSNVTALPAPLRRLAGVGCTACHGPGAIPPEQARWAILRSDVCATCHDAPPRYGHVAAWRRTAMARSDADPRSREGECASCHTTAGFLASIGVEPARTVGEPMGIACAACHAPHANETGPRLLRLPPVPPGIATATVPAEARVCVRCHESSSDGLAWASTASVWLGATPSGPREAVHAGVDRGCVGCHRVGPPELERGAGHAFEVREEACAACHDEPLLDRVREQQRDQRARAVALWARLVARGAVEGGANEHASAMEIRTRDPELARAARISRFVLADPGVAAHAPGLAEPLLGQAEASERSAPRAGRR